MNLTEEEILSQTHGTIGEIVARFFPDNTPEEHFHIGERKEALYRQIYEPHLRPLPGLGEFLDWTKKHHMPCALATAGNSTNINFITDGLGIRSYFSAFVGGDDVTHGKPHPEVFLTAAAGLGIAPKNASSSRTHPPESKPHTAPG